MSRAFRFGVANVAKNGIPSLFGDASNIARKVKLCYIGDANNTSRKFYEKIQPGTVWENISVPTWTQAVTAQTHFGIARGNMWWVIAHPDKVRLTSQNYRTWTVTTDTVALYAAGAGNNTLVIGGASGTIRTATEAASLTWTNRTSGVTSAIRDYDYGNGMFVAVTSSGEILTSPDAVTWTKRTSPVSTPLNTVKYAEDIGLWCIAGDNAVILTSTDGINWTNRQISIESYYDVTRGKGNFVKVGLFPGLSAYIRASSDGITWASKGATSAVRSIAFGDGLFAMNGTGISGQANSGTQGIWTSFDLSNWTLGYATNNFNGAGRIRYGKGAFVAIGNNKTLLISDH